MFADSVRRIFTVLKSEGLLSTEELSNKTNISKRTIRYAVNKLNEMNILIKYRSFKDMRKIIYGVG